MKRKEKFYIDAKKRKICKGEEYIWNTLTINTEKLKWNPEYRNRCIQKFADILQKRKEIKPIKIKYNTGKKKYFSSKINHLEPKEFVSRAEIKIIDRNEQAIKFINEIKIKD